MKITHANPKCPHCGRELTPDEIYCYFCEMNVYDLWKKQKKSGRKIKKAAAVKMRNKKIIF